jgi:hypothetical protein
MADFGTVAVNVAKRWAENKSIDPHKVWAEECLKAGLSDSLVRKGCPKGTFLGLCEEELVKDIDKGNYTKSIKNKSYGLAAVKILAKNPSLTNSPYELWDAILEEVPDRCQTPNHQMDVVIELWVNNLIKH